MKTVILKSIGVALLMSVVGAVPAFAAYIDPNTGGMLFQMLAMLLALFSGILLFFSAQIRMTIARFKRYLQNRNKAEVQKVTNENVNRGP